MSVEDFIKLKTRYDSASTQDKIDIYLNTEGLDKSQYMSLLKSFPINELDKLEKAMG